MRLFFDTEFLDAGPSQPLRLISVGLVADDGREYYAESSEFDEAELTGAESGPWLRANVLPHLEGPRRTLAEIAEDVRHFVLQGIGVPEFWGYFCAYDWVLLCQLYGRMLDVPLGFPHLAFDVRQLAASVGARLEPPHLGRQHHALDDARWTRDFYRYLLREVAP